MTAVSFLPTPDMLHDSLCDMPIFNIHHERLFFEFPENMESPPESPCYSTTMSDVSGEEFVELPSPKEFSHDAMWGAGHTDSFLASSVSWIPGAMDSDFDSLVHFADDTIVAIDELHEAKPQLMLPVAITHIEPDVKPKTLKRKASSDNDERPIKKSKNFTPASSPSPSLPLTSELSSRSSDDPEAKRLTHNVLERRRRNDLKNSYQQLRVMIPSLEDNERAPTGQILIHAVDHITALKMEEETLLAELAAARAENERLRAMFAMN